MTQRSGKARRAIVGVLTCMPLAYFATLILLLILEESNAPSGGTIPVYVEHLFGATMVAILVTWGYVGCYLLYLFRTSRVPKDKKALWAVTLVICNLFAMLVFWYLYVWRAGNDDRQD